MRLLDALFAVVWDDEVKRRGFLGAVVGACAALVGLRAARAARHGWSIGSLSEIGSAPLPESIAFSTPLNSVQAWTQREFVAAGHRLGKSTLVADETRRMVARVTDGAQNPCAHWRTTTTPRESSDEQRSR